MGNEEFQGCLCQRAEGEGEAGNDGSAPAGGGNGQQHAGKIYPRIDRIAAVFPGHIQQHGQQVTKEAEHNTPEQSREDAAFPLLAEGAAILSHISSFVLPDKQKD